MILSEASALPAGMEALRAGSGAGGQYSRIPTFPPGLRRYPTGQRPIGAKPLTWVNRRLLFLNGFYYCAGGKFAEMRSDLVDFGLVKRQILRQIHYLSIIYRDIRFFIWQIHHNRNIRP